MLDLLLLKGFSLQLKHEEAEVQNGFVTVFDVNGKKLAHAPKIQLLFRGNRDQLVASFVDECLASFSQAVDEVASSKYVMNQNNSSMAGVL